MMDYIYLLQCESIKVTIISPLIVFYNFGNEMVKQHDEDIIH